ncbi:MAG: EboA domain-containing protein [Verrucomicrobiales bacterium]|nr:EboA domain-containing protein [bacterium]MDF2377891.1 EboA domain-containing protein [Verrucomicrobiales bacterium]
MREKILNLLSENASPDAVAWLRETISSQEAAFEKRPFYYAFSGVSRHFDKAGRLPADADEVFGGWDQYRLARVALLLLLAPQGKEVFVETFHAILNTADLREQVALFSALPWLPHPEDIREAAVDGLRSNIVDIYDSIALDNAFPARHFSDDAWNQMVLKAIFITRPLHRIVGIADRKNQRLAEAISDLAHERWAAGRTITPEAWQNCEGFINERLAHDITRISESEIPDDRAAAALVTSTDRSGKLENLRDSLVAELSHIQSGALTWKSLGQSMEEKLVRKSLT